MNRRDFIRKVGVFAIGAPIAGKLIIDTISKEPEVYQGLLAQIKTEEDVATYRKVTYEEIKELVDKLVKETFNERRDKFNKFVIYGQV